MRAPHRRDQRQWMDVRRLSKDFLQPWEPTWPEDGAEKTAFRRRPRRFRQDWEGGTSYPFFIFHRETDDLVGGITLSNLRRGVTQAGTIGYWMGLPYVRRGHMAEAVDLILEFAFEGLGLHRVEAACLVHNEPAANFSCWVFPKKGSHVNISEPMGGGRTIGRSAFCAAIGKRRANFDGYVSSLARKQAQIDADLCDGVLPFCVVIRPKGEVGVVWDVQPCVLSDSLAVELSGSPAGIAKGQQKLLGAPVLRDVLQDIDCCRQRHAIGDLDRAFLAVFGGMQTNPRPVSTGPPNVSAIAAQPQDFRYRVALAVRQTTAHQPVCLRSSPSRLLRCGHTYR